MSRATLIRNPVVGKAAVQAAGSLAARWRMRLMAPPAPPATQSRRTRQREPLYRVDRVLLEIHRRLRPVVHQPVVLAQAKLAHHRGQQGQAGGARKGVQRQVLHLRHDATGGRQRGRQAGGVLAAQRPQLEHARHARRQLALDGLYAFRRGGQHRSALALDHPRQPAAQHQHRRALFRIQQQRRGQPVARLAIVVAVVQQYTEFRQPGAAGLRHAPRLQVGRRGRRRQHQRRLLAAGLDSRQNVASLVGPPQLPLAQRGQDHHGDPQQEQSGYRVAG